MNSSEKKDSIIKDFIHNKKIDLMANTFQRIEIKFDVKIIVSVIKSMHGFTLFYKIIDETIHDEFFQFRQFQI